jgi:hypothetical protein
MNCLASLESYFAPIALPENSGCFAFQRKYCAAKTAGIVVFAHRPRLDTRGTWGMATIRKKLGHKVNFASNSLPGLIIATPAMITEISAQSVLGRVSDAGFEPSQLTDSTATPYAESF